MKIRFYTQITQVDISGLDGNCSTFFKYPDGFEQIDEIVTAIIPAFKCPVKLKGEIYRVYGIGMDYDTEELIVIVKTTVRKRKTVNI